MKRWTISAKLIGLALAGTLGAIALLGWISVSRGTAALLAQQTEALEAVRRSRQHYVERSLAIIREQIFNFAQDQMIVEATRGFADAFGRVPEQLGSASNAPAHLLMAGYYETEFRTRLEAAGRPWRGLDHYLPTSPAARILQGLYLAGNPRPVGEKHRLDTAGVSADYDRLHRRYHPRVRDFLESFGYYDIFLFDLEGNMVYSVFKETDFATNFLSGPYRDSNLADVYREARAAETSGNVVVRDFRAYEPSYGAPASFIGAPVYSQDRKLGEDRKLGVAIFQMPVDEINAIMTEVAGLGETGETYLVGADGLMRSDSRFAGRSTILARTVDSEAARRALDGESGVLVQPDYRGVEVLSSYGPIEVAGLHWAMLAEIDMDEVTAPATALRGRIVAFGALVGAVMVVLALAALRRVVIRPVQSLARSAERVEAGDYSARVHISSGDELGELAHSFNHMARAIEHEIAERTQAENELRGAREVADEANRAKSAFLANMSHELRTPMNAIIGYSEMLMEEAEDSDDAASLADLRKIHAAGRHLLALINSVLDLSKIEAGRMELYLESFDVSEMLDDAIGTVASVVEKKNNRLEVDRGPDLGSMHGDLTKVRQTLFNLLSNAAKFTEEGAITLAARRLQEDGRDWLQFSISDSGIGIPADKLDSIFEEFAQADDSTTRIFGGTGLGLSITRRFCQMMEGEVRVESVLGEGSTFTVRLPARVGPEPEAEPRPRAGVHPEREGRSILVVDDDPVALDLVGRTLTGAGFEVITAGSGEKALRLAREVRPDAITLDVMMPEMDGWEVLRSLKEDPNTCDIPVIMVTMTDDRDMGAALGATDFLTKPVERRQLVALLERYSASGAERTALVVDDQPEVREVMRRALEGLGWQVAEAENGREGLASLAVARPALILLDLMMPVMDGFQFLMEVRKKPELRTIPIVVVTAKDVTEEDRRRLNGDVTALIQKQGSNREALLDQIRDLVASTRTTSAPD